MMMITCATLTHGAKSEKRGGVPYLSVNVQADTVTEHANPFDCETEVYRLCDEEFVYQHFQNDLMLYTLMAKSTDPDDARQLVSSIPERVGIKHKHDNNYLKLSHTIDSIILEDALFSTRKVVEDADRFANDWVIKLMILLSFGRQRLKDDLMRRPRFDQVDPRLDAYPEYSVRNRPA